MTQIETPLLLAGAILLIVSGLYILFSGNKDKEE